MLPNRTFYILGAAFIFASVFVLYFSFQGLTGFAVYTDTRVSPDYTFSLWFFISGLLLIAFPKMLARKSPVKNK